MGSIDRSEDTGNVVYLFSEVIPLGEVSPAPDPEATGGSAPPVRGCSVLDALTDDPELRRLYGRLFVEVPAA